MSGFAAGAARFGPRAVGLAVRQFDRSYRAAKTPAVRDKIKQGVKIAKSRKRGKGAEIVFEDGEKILVETLKGGWSSPMGGVASVAGTALGAGFVGSTFMGNLGPAPAQQAGIAADLYREQLSTALEGQRLLEDKLTNTALLARTNPRLFAQLAAGRRLAEGSIMIGNTVRNPGLDLLERITAGMATGAI